MPSHSLHVLCLLPALGVAVSTPGQQALVFQVPGRAIQEPEGDDIGPAVEMSESPNLDRFLRRARQFLVEEKYQEAILVLQAVVEGRTLEALSADATEAPQPPAPEPDRAQAGRPEPKAILADPTQTVFSSDGRIYRPARRLCHEYLATMPVVGIELYQSLHETLAQELLAAALASGQVLQLEQVANRYFTTLAAGRAMQALADRHMHEGRYRAAVQVLRDLAELYPAANLQKLGITPLWCRFKIALCLRLAGEVGAAIDAARQLAVEFPDESLRIMGELQPVRELVASALFTAGDDSVVGGPGVAADRGGSSLLAAGDPLVPLWQFRFRGANPYAVTPARRSNEQVWVENAMTNAAPHASKYGTGTQVAFLGHGSPRPQAVFLEHYRLRVADAFSGLLQLEGDGESDAPKPPEMRPRARVPVYDFALQTTVEDEQRYYVVVGYSKPSQGVEALKVNRIVAYDKQTGQRLWTSDAYEEGDDGLAEVTFLAAPTVFGERLLAPTLRRGAYELQCLDRRNGRPLWHTRIHAGGTRFFKAPGTPVLVAGNLAYVLTNAGAIAAVDAFAGDLRWIRRYERTDPLRQRPVGRRGSNPRQGMFPNQMQFVEQEMQSFLPSAMLHVAGTIVFAGCDGDMLLCVDGASGEPIWMVDGSTRYAPYGRMQYLVGANDRHLYVAADSDSRHHLVCIEMASGIVRWAREVPGASERLTRWRGRGCVTASEVLMPGDREVLVLDAGGAGDWRRIALPPFGLGDEPLRGPNNLYLSGPWLGVSYATGIEVYSTAVALGQLAASAAAEPLAQADFLVQAGRIPEALENLTTWLDGPAATGPEVEAARQRGADRVVALARELALQQGSAGVAILDRVRPYATARPARLAWHLARLDLFGQENDLRAYEEEQQRLYRFMEGKE